MNSIQWWKIDDDLKGVSDAEDVWVGCCVEGLYPATAQPSFHTFVYTNYRHSLMGGILRAESNVNAANDKIKNLLFFIAGRDHTRARLSVWWDAW